MRRSRFSNTTILFIVLLFLSRMQYYRNDPAGYFYDIVIMLPGIILGLSLHEFGHAFVADRLGDPLPRSQGRVTVNPLAHIDPMGLVCLIFGGFGWGKPVMIGVNAYKNPRRDRLFVAFAGVIMNAVLVILLAFITKGVLAVLPSGLSGSTKSAGTIILDILIQAIAVNIMLMIFNLLPIPPLDGFNIVTEIFNLRNTSWYQKFYSMGGIILFALILFRLTGKILTPAVQAVYGFVVQHIILG